MIETEPRKQKAVLVFPSTEKQSDVKRMRREAELISLAGTMGAETVCSLFYVLRKISAATLLGKGQLEEVAENVRFHEADLVIFDTALSPTALRNLENSLDICCIDREEVILQIFADRASTREAVLQVSLARAEYSLPRLSRRWEELSQQRGGVRGSKGAGETMLELDRRHLESEIVKLKKELAKVKQTRSTQRKGRESDGIYSFALAGYTNAGKSSLMNALCGSDTLVEDKLFATLDTTTRKLVLPGGAEAVISDTVGFVSDLPHNLVEAFSSTLEEAVYADCLIIVTDSSSAAAEDELKTTEEVLDSLGCGAHEKIHVLSKSDKEAEDEIAAARIHALLPDAVEVSVKSGEGLDKLRALIQQKIESGYITEKAVLKADDTASIAAIYRQHRVISAEYDDETVEITYRRKA